MLKCVDVGIQCYVEMVSDGMGSFKGNTFFPLEIGHPIITIITLNHARSAYFIMLICADSFTPIPYSIT